MAIKILCMFLILCVVALDGSVAYAKKIGYSANPKYLTVNCNCGAQAKQLSDTLSRMEKKLDQCLAEVGGNCISKEDPKNCLEVLKRGQKKSGVYKIKPDLDSAFEVYCDQTTSGGGWVVIQRRIDKSVDFYRKWEDYKKGFGSLVGNFWLGLDKIHRLTQQTKNELRVELEDMDKKTAYAIYKQFSVDSEHSKYKLHVGSYSGTAGDSLKYHNNRAFSTYDRDNDDYQSHNCAKLYKGAWWYGACHHANLNGRYLAGKHKSNADGINWYTWKGYHYSVKRSEMKIRPVQ